MAMSVITRGYIFCMEQFQSPFLITFRGAPTVTVPTARALPVWPWADAWGLISVNGPYGGVSINGCTPHSWMVYMEKPSINGWFGGTPISGNLHMSPYPLMMFTSLPAIKAVMTWGWFMGFTRVYKCLPHFREFQDPKMKVLHLLWDHILGWCSFRLTCHRPEKCGRYLQFRYLKWPNMWSYYAFPILWKSPILMRV